MLNTQSLKDTLPVPIGKKVKFINSGSSLLSNSYFLLEKGITIDCRSDFRPIIDSASSQILTMAGGVIGGLTGSNLPVTNKYLGFQLWAGTDPLSFTFNISTHMKVDAFSEVVQPMQELMKIPLPKVADNFDFGKISLNFGDWGGLSAPGPDVLSVLLNKKNAQDLMTIKLGPCTIPKCIIDSVQTSFSNEVDSSGHPIWATATVSAKTIFTANNEMISSLFSLANID